MNMAWKTLTGKFDTNHEGIETLINKAASSQWSIRDILWSAYSPVLAAIDSSPAIAPLRDLISQAYYAELATIEVCSQLMQSDIGLQAKRFIATQITDEARHAEAYGNYLEKLGGPITIHPKMNEIFSSVIKDNELPDLAKVIAINILLEGEALNQQGKRGKAIPCPIFDQINRLILIDEARHHAFGKMFVPMLAKKHSLQELSEVGFWCKDVWANWTLANAGRYEQAGAEQFKVLEDEIQKRWPVYENELSKMGIIFESEEEVCLQ
ncbi:MAG: ferritin-like domain-containing protein [Bdellovibrionales bacterium]|nr:ferritin-like domain-containing protein [Bdellovibrionales bacterium]